jgi:hypothetical protein
MEAREIMYLFETLRYEKDEAMAGFDVVSSFSTMMTSLMDSRAYLKMDSFSMSDPEYSSGWLHLFTRSDVKATTRRVPVRLGDMAQCWEKNDDDSGQEEDEDNEQEEPTDFYEVDLEASQSPEGLAERADAIGRMDEMVLELERLGVDVHIRSLLQLIAPDLSALKAMDDGDEMFGSIVEEQMQKIRPLLSASSSEARTPAAGQMFYDARRFPGSDDELLRSWFLQHGVTGSKLQEILCVCVLLSSSSPPVICVICKRSASLLGSFPRKCCSFVWSRLCARMDAARW